MKTNKDYKIKRVYGYIAAIYWWVQLIKDPSQLGTVINLSNSLLKAGSSEDFDKYVSSVRADKKGDHAFQVRLRLSKVKIKELEALPKNTLGAAYAQFLKDHHLAPDDLPIKTDATDIEYIAAHLFETHDIWHVMTGFSPDVPGELGLQAFYLAQFPSTTAYFLIAAGMLNTVFFRSANGGERLESISRGWRMGKKSKKLFGTNWSELWEKDLTQLRAEFGLIERSALVTAELAYQ